MILVIFLILRLLDFFFSIFLSSFLYEHVFFFPDNKVFSSLYSFSLPFLSRHCNHRFICTSAAVKGGEENMMLKC